MSYLSVLVVLLALTVTSNSRVCSFTMKPPHEDLLGLGILSLIVCKLSLLRGDLVEHGAYAQDTWYTTNSICPALYMNASH